MVFQNNHDSNIRDHWLYVTITEVIIEKCLKYDNNDPEYNTEIGCNHVQLE